MSQFATVTIKVDGGEVSASPDPVTLAYEEEPNQVKWVIPEFPPGAVAVDVFWKTATKAFKKVVPGQSEAGATVLLGLENTKIEGDIDYGIRFLSANGHVVVEADPKIRNLPWTKN